MERRGPGIADRLLDHDPLRPGQQLGDLLGQGVIAGDQADRHAPRPEDERVEAVLAGRPAGEPRLDRTAGVRVGDDAGRMAGTGVVADEQRDVHAGVGPGAGHHGPDLLALDDARRADGARRAAG